MATHQPTHNHHLYGSCACERNQYEIAIPQNHEQNQTHAHVFFDNSRANRRSQAAPLTAWLRIPLAWYHSSTQAYFPDESHAAIRRTFYTPGSLIGNGSTEVRKQFCGFCGTHLNAWREAESEKEWMDVTLGSLWGESVDLLEGLGWLENESSEEEEEDSPSRDATRLARPTSGSMRNRGIPYFEEMVEDSRLGRIKRRKGGHVNADGSSVEWEVTEIEGEEGETVMREVDEGGNGNKRLKLGD